MRGGDCTSVLSLGIDSSAVSGEEMYRFEAGEEVFKLDESLVNSINVSEATETSAITDALAFAVDSTCHSLFSLSSHR